LSGELEVLLCDSDKLVRISVLDANKVIAAFGIDSLFVDDKAVASAFLASSVPLCNARLRSPPSQIQSFSPSLLPNHAKKEIKQ
jgi:hypothetical protein